MGEKQVKKDVLKRIVGDANPLEELMAKIPGFKGYLDIENRREADKLQRDFLVTRLGEHKKRLEQVKRKFVDGLKFDALEPLDRLLDRLDKVISRIRYADRGYSGLFDAVKMDRDAVETLLLFDLALVKYVDAIGEALSGLSSCSDERMNEAMGAVEEKIDELDEKFSQREQVVAGVM